jgi:type IV secretory pathway TraG/TraD family ATPase VirD4
VHGEAQLRTRWQADGAQAVLDTCGVKAWLPGITDPATLRTASELCGQACFTEREHGGRYYGSRYRRQRYRIWHDVMTAHMIRQLPAGHALIIRGSAAPVIARLRAAWKDRHYHATRHQPPAPEPPAGPGLPGRPGWPPGPPGDPPLALTPAGTRSQPWN